jgi:hypothetical protein
MANQPMKKALSIGETSLLQNLALFEAVGKVNYQTDDVPDNKS